MYKKTIEFEDFDGVKRTEDFYFHLTKAELMEFVMMPGKFTIDKILENIINEHDNAKLIEYFKKLIKMSYGKKSEDGRRFMKSEEIWNDFAETEAYSILFMELASDDKKAAEFAIGIMPKDLQDDFKNIDVESIPDDLKDSIAPLLPPTT